MTDNLHFLQQRNSSPRLVEPAPSAAALEAIFQAALRAPDHAWLRPWRFITIAGERRRDFGQVLERCLRQRNPQADEAALQKARGAPLRAPLLVVVVARLTDHPKVPAMEQRLSARDVAVDRVTLRRRGVGDAADSEDLVTDAATPGAIDGAKGHRPRE